MEDQKKSKPMNILYLNEIFNLYASLEFPKSFA